MPISKYMRRECSTLLSSKSKQQAHKMQNDAVDAISFGPSPVCIVISRAGEECVKELEDVDGGMFRSLSKFLGGSTDKVCPTRMRVTCTDMVVYRHTCKCDS